MNRTLFEASIPAEHREEFLKFFDAHADKNNTLDIAALEKKALASDNAVIVAQTISVLSLIPDRGRVGDLIKHGLNWPHNDPWNAVSRASLAAIPHCLTRLDGLRAQLEELAFHDDAVIRNMAVDLLEADEETEEDRQLERWRRFKENTSFRTYWPFIFLGRRHTITSFNAREDDFRKGEEDE
ncbi:hypothetical protein WNY37_13360 [Henriciella sp. AS95]|uniref:hypothetical protein n=1 Tax=Henriciella sp. AS95 TaxID=3135782 RepID=UPI003178D9DD